MARALHDSRTARGFLARCLVALTAVTGLLMLLSPPCNDGMSVMPAASVDSATSAARAPEHAQPVTAQVASSCGWHAMSSPAEPYRPGDGSAVFPTVVSDSSSPLGPVGVVLTCVVLLVAVLVSVLGLWQPWRPDAAGPPQPLLRAEVSASPVRPTLTQLCVLRI